MWFRSMFDSMKHLRTSAPVQRKPRPETAHRLQLKALENRCLPSFYAPISYAVGEEPRAVAVGDLNGDDRPDLVVANMTSNSVSVLLGNADGTFHPARSFATGAVPMSVAVGDFNGDGRNGVVTVNAYDVGLGLLLGNGDGTLQPARTVGDAVYQAAVPGDFTGDGRLDLVTVDYDRVSHFRGNGDGTFQAAQTITLPDQSPPDLPGWPLAQHPLSVSAADLNADGRLDLVVTAETVYTTTYAYFDEYGNLWSYEYDVYNGYLNIILGNGDGTFTTRDTELIAQNDHPDSWGPLAADFNRDGKTDLATTYSVSLGNGDGTYRPPVYFAAGDNRAAVAAGDFNGDGFPDLAVANAGSDDVSVVLNTRDWRSLVVGGFPSPATAGEPGSLTVTALDGTGRLLPTYTGTVHFTSTDAHAALPADYTFTAADGGMHTFVFTLKTAGYQNIAVTDVVTTGPTGSQNVRVDPGAASQFTVSGYPSPTREGDAPVFTVTASDPYGNVASGYRGTVHFTSSDGGASLPADYAFTAADAGAHRFSATFNTSGTQSLTARDTAAGFSGTQSGITVIAVTHLVASAPPGATAGAAFSVTVSALADGAPATGYTGTVRFTSNDPRADLPADYTFTAADQGVHTFTVALKAAGTQSLWVTDLWWTATGARADITVSPTATSRFWIAGFPPPVTAGAASSFTVTASDAYGNRTTGYTGAVHFTSTDPRAVLPAGYNFTAADTGQHTFSATLKTAGTQSLTATDTTGAIAGTLYVTVNSAAASRLVLSAPASVNANAAFSVTATVVDAYGNIVTGYRGTLSFGSSDAMANLPKKYTFTAADQGVHAFTNLRLKKKGKQTVTVTDTLDGSLTASVIIDVR